MLYLKGEYVMSNGVKLWIIIAVLLSVIGMTLFAVSMSVSGWDITKLSTDNYETNTHDLTEEFFSISIKTDTSDVVFKPSDDGKSKVVCYEEKNQKHSVTVADGVLTVSIVDTRKWYEYIGINFGSPRITVYLSEKEYSTLVIKGSTGDILIPKELRTKSIDVSVSTGDVKCYAGAPESLKIKSTTGDITVSDVSAGSIELSVTTGNVTLSGIICDRDISIGVSTGDTSLTDITCKSLISSGSTGDIVLKNVIATEKLSVERSTGDVKLDASDGSEIFVKTDTGDVTGSLLTDKIFITKTDTGKTDVPKSVTGGRCEITTDTGDIKITVGSR